MAQVRIEIKGEELPAKVLRRLGVSPQATVFLSAEAGSGVEPSLSEDMDIRDFSKIMAARLQARGLTDEAMTSLLDISDEERRNILGS
jgi:hypothetical protein